MCADTGATSADTSAATTSNGCPNSSSNDAIQLHSGNAFAY